MKRAFLIVALAFGPAPTDAQVQFGISHSPGQPAFGAQTLPLPGNMAPSVPPGGTNPSGSGSGYAAPVPIPRSSANGAGTTSLGSVGPAVRPSGNAPSPDEFGVPPGSEADARGKVAHAGYGSVSTMTKGQDGVWRGTAKLDTKDVRVEVDMFGAVRAY
jgi:hypothetical protein